MDFEFDIETSSFGHVVTRQIWNIPLKHFPSYAYPPSLQSQECVSCTGDGQPGGIWNRMYGMHANMIWTLPGDDLE